MLFNKKTRNVIKYIWGVFAVLIIFSMVTVYSGFTGLTQSQSSQPIELTQEELDALRTQQTGNTPEEQHIIDAIESGEMQLDLGTSSNETHISDAPDMETPVEEVPQLNFSL